MMNDYNSLEHSKDTSFKRTFKKKLALLVVFLLFGVLGVNAQVTASGSGLSATYPSLSAAITALNSATITSPVTITLTGNETAPVGGYNITASGTSTNTITIQGSGSTITAATGLTSGSLVDAIFKITGGDWITIQNFTMQENAANTTTTAASNNMTEFGVALFYATATNGAQNCTIQNNTISLNRTYQNTFAIYSNSTHTATVVATAATATGTTGGNSGLKVYGNNISNVNMGIVIVGPTAIADANTGIDIGGSSSTTGNTITNFGTTATFSNYINVSGTVNGILIRNSNGFNISYNSITSSNGGVTSGTLNGIQVAAASTAPTATFTNTINNNTISLRSGASGIINGITYPSGSASATSVLNVNNNNFTSATTTVANTSAVTLISIASTNLTTNINNNTFTNISSNTSGTFTFISHSFSIPASGTCTISGNSIVTGFTKTVAGAVTLTTTNGSSPNTATNNYTNNNFSNIIVPDNAASAILGFNNTDGSTSASIKNVSGNTFNNWHGGTVGTTGTSSSITVMNFTYWNGASSLSNNTITNIAGRSTITGINIGATYNNATTLNVSNNTINNLASIGLGAAVTGISCSNTSTVININGNVINALSTTAGSAVTGISIAGATLTNIYQNKIYNLSGSNASSTVNGILISSGTNVNTYNNLIGDLRASVASGTDVIRGISITSTTATSNQRVYYNTIYLNATSSGANFGSSGIFHTYSATATTAALDMRNNIISNASGANGTGLAVAFRRSAATDLNNYASTSNNNLFFGTSGLYNNGTTNFTTLSTYQAAVGTRESASRAQNPTFASTNGADGTFLHFTAGAVNLAGGNGQVIAGYTTDFDGDTRDASTPDIGADEWANGTIAPPTVASFTPTTLCVQGGQTVTITGTNLGAVTSVLFNGSTGLNLAGTITGATATTLTVTAPANVVDGGIIVTNPAGSFDTTGSLAFTAAPTPTITVSPSSASICTGSSVTLTANGGSTYTWSPATGLSATTGASVTANPTATTTYTVIGTSAAGCTSSTTVTVTVNPVPSAVSVSKNPTSICDGGITTLTATGGTVTGTASSALGAGASTSSSLGGSMFPGAWGGAKTQYLIRASELTALGITAGNINSVAFEATVSGQAYPGFALSIGTTAQTVMSTTNGYLGGLTQVFTSASFTPTVGVNTLTFSTPFNWDGTSNIVLSFCWSTALTTSTSSTVKTDTAAFNSSYGWNVDSQSSATVCATTGVPTGGNTPVVGTIRPRFIFGYSTSTPTTFAWTPTTGLFTNAAATTAYTGQNATTVYAKLPNTTPVVYTVSSTLGSCSASNTVTVSPNALPTITSSGNVTICNGGSTTLTANGASTYTWSPATGLSSTTGSSVTANPTATTTYTITGADANGCSNTTTLTVTVNAPVVITAQPSNAIVLENADATFSLTATGDGLAYQWQENTGSGWSNISGANSSSLTLTAVTASMSGYQYRCIVSGAAPCASVTSDVKTLTVSSVSISAQPTNQTICSNGVATFTFTATGDTSYQWQVSTNSGVTWTNLSGETSHDLVLSGLNSSSTGNRYRCLINGGSGAGGVDTDSALLTVNDAVSIITQPSNQAVCSNGGSVAFSVAGIGTSVTYQWQVNTGSGWSNISGQTSASYSIATPTVAMNGYQYRAIVAGAAPCSSVTSDVATLNVYQAVSITTQPVSVSNCTAPTVGFSVVANGSGLTYQWVGNNGSDITLTNGTDFSGVNTASLTVLNPAAYSGYTFKVVVSGTAPCSSVTSSSATLTQLPQLTGVKTVGTGGDFATLTAAIAAYNASTCITGNVVFNLIDTNYSTAETFPININSNANAGSYTLTIKPATTATISGSSASAIIKLNGADNVIIDGSNSGSTDKSLTIVNNNTGTSSSVVWVGSASASNGANNVTVKNIIAKGNAPATTFGAIVAGSGTTIGGAAEVANNNLTIQNNTVTDAQYGIVVAGSATAQTGTVVSSNTIGSNTAADYIGWRGIFISNSNGAVVSNNNIFNIITTITNPCGVFIAAGVTNSTFNANRVDAIRYTGTSGYGGKGFDVNSASATSNLTISNNMISNLGGDGWNNLTGDSIVGIRVGATGAATTTTGGVKIYNNTVSLSGSFAGNTSGTLSAALYISSTATNIDVRNNILVNSLDNTATTSDSAYAIYSAAANTAFSSIDYNDYFVSGTPGKLGFLTSDRTNLAGIIAGFGGNANSLNIAPNFNSATDLHLNVGTNAGLDNLGTALAGITTDYDGDTRSATTPDMGADEFATLTCASQTLAGGTISSTVTSFCNTTSGATISANGYTIGVGTTYQWESATDLAFTSPTNVGSVLSNYANLSTGALSSTTYYRLKVICNGGSAAYSNVIGIIKNTPAVTTVSPNVTICAGGSATLTANGSSTYSWSPATGLSATSGATVTAQPTATTTYTVTGTDANGCSTTATVTVTVNAYPSAVSATAGLSQLCVDSVTSLTATGGTVGASGSATLGTATTLTSATTQPTAFCNRWSQYWGQTIYTAAELSAAGLTAGSSITSIAYNITTIGDAAGNANYAIRIGNTTNTVFTTAFQTTGLTTVYGPTTYTHAIGVNTITFTTPYVWDGTSNIVIDVRHDGIDATNNAITYFTAAADNKTITAITSTTSSTTTLQALVAAATVTPTTSTQRLNVVLGYNSTVPTVMSWSPTTNLYTNAGATTPYTGGNANVVYFKPSTAGSVTYIATASNGSCTTSGSVSVEGLALPAFTIGNVTMCQGAPVNLSVSSTEANTYSWSPATGLSSTTGSSVTANPSVTTTYTVTATSVTNNCSKASTVTVTVDTPPSASSISPLTNNVAVGQTSSFTVTAAGTGITYQWQVNDGSGYVNITNNSTYSGATTAELTITNPTAEMSGYQYQCVVSGTAACSTPATSPAGTLNVDSTGITTQPVNTTVCAGSTATFTTVASSIDPEQVITYAWEIMRVGETEFSAITDGLDSATGLTFSGSETGVLSMTGTTAANTGIQFRTLINGYIYSSTVTLTVNSAVAITTQPSSASVCNGASVTFTGAASNATTYQWQLSTDNGSSWNNISGANSASLNLTASIADNGKQYRLVVNGTSPCPSVTSDVATLSVLNPIISSQPVASSVLIGNATSFSVVASPATSYQWQYATTAGGTYTDVVDGTPAGITFSGANTATLTVNADLSAAGGTGNFFRCVVTNSSCTTNSAAAQLTVVAYCASSANNTSDEEIYNVTFNGASTDGAYANTNGCTAAAPGPGSILSRYSNFVTLGSLTTVTRNQNVTFTVAQNECDGATYYSNGVAIWIDYNVDGDFDDAGEKVFVENTTAAASASGSRLITGTITIPATATLGVTRMRVIAGEGLSGTSLVPCGTYGYGETEDYAITIAPQPTCSGTPVAGTVSASATSICNSGSVSLTANGFSSGAIGLSYQWYNSAGAISGANSATYTTPVLTANESYYFRVSCANSGLSADSNTVAISVTNTAITSSTPAGICGTGTATLSATANGSNIVNWYSAATGGALLGTGTSFTTPSISATTTYYAEAATPVETISGLGNTGAGPFDTTGASAERGIVFTATQSGKIVSAQYYSPTLNVTNTVTVRLVNNTTGTQVGSSLSLPIVQGATPGFYTMNLNLDVVAGTTYRLLASFSQSVNRIATGVNYASPAFNNLAPLGTIISGYDSGSSTTTYSYFHNIVVSASRCTSARTAVVATVTPQPTATITYSGSPYCYSAGLVTPAITGTNAYTGGTWSSTNVDMNAALAVNGNGSFNTNALPAGNTTVTYPITYTIPATGNCSAQSVTVNVVVKPGSYASNTADFSYSSSSVCTSGGIITPTLSNAYGIAGAFTASPAGLTLNGSTGAINLATSTPGTYTVSNTVTECSQNLVGTFTITVNQGPSITSQPVATTVCNGANASFTAAGSGTGVTYQWQVSTNAGASYTNISGETAATLNLTAVTNSMNGNLYRVVISDASGCGAALNSNGAALTVSQPAAPVFSPAAPAICAGGTQAISVSSASFPQNGVIGTGTVSNTLSTPFKGFWGGSKVQMLYTAAELSALGYSNGTVINAVGLDVTSFTSPYTFNGFTVAMKNTSSTSLTTTLESGTTTVRNPSNYVLSGTAPFTANISLDTPFTWNGTSNLLVEFCFNNNDGGGVSANSANVASSTVTGSTVYFSADNTATVCSAPGTGTTTSTRPNMRFGVSGGGTLTWSPTTGLFTDAAATIAYTGGNATTLYAKPTATSTYTVTATSTLGCTNTSTVTVNVNPLPTLGSITQPATTCAGSQTTFNLTGLIPNSTSTITYTVNAGAPVTVSGIVANGSGNASFSASLASFTNGQTLAITSIQRTDNTPNCSATITSNNTVTISVQPIVTYYADADGDGFGNAAVSTVTCTGAPSGYVTNNTDCNDADPTRNATFSFYVDADGDTFGAGSLVSGICAVNATTPPSGYSVNNTDCNDADATKNATFPFYVDADGDSYGAGSVVSVCAVNSTTPPSGYASNNTDCNDSNASIYQFATFFVDADGDGYTNGTASVCSGTSAPAGYSATSAGTDCNDSNPAVYQTSMLYVDADGDGYTVGAATSVCYGASIPTGYSATSAGTDCDDTNASITTGGTYYADADGDGFGNAAVSTTACTMPSGYVSNSTDCDDTNASIYQLATFYVDADGDGWDNGTASVCSGTSAPAGYSATTSGTDCDDTNPLLTNNCSTGKVVNLNLFIQGYYIGGGLMNSVKLNQDYVSPDTDVEDMTIELHDATTYALVDTATGTLHTDGTLSVTFNTAAAGDYYIAVKGLNIIQTWSAAPVTIGSTAASYDFTTSASQAYGDNMLEIEPGVFAMYSGELAADDFIDTTDYVVWETDYNNSAFGVYATDLNGDGFVDGTDYVIWEGNYNNFVFAFYPF